MIKFGIASRFNFMVATLLLTSLSAAAAEPAVEQARQLLKEKKYSEAGALLEAQLNSGKPSADLLRVAMEAKLLSGDIVFASRLAAEALKTTKNQDMELIRRAAEIAALAGDSKLALSRYYTYCMNVKERDANFIEALNYVVEEGINGDVFAMQMELNSPVSNGLYAYNFYNKLLENREFDQAARVLPLMLKLYGNNQVIFNEIFRSINRAKANISDKEKLRILDIVSKMSIGDKVRIGELNSLLYEFYKSINDEEKSAFALEFIKNSGKPLEWQFFQSPFNASVGKLLSNAAIREQADKYLALEKVYRSEPRYYYEYVLNILRSPKIFANPADPALTTDQMIQLYVQTAKLFDNKLPDDKLCNEIVNNLLKEDKPAQIKFLSSNIASLRPNWVSNLFAMDLGNVKNYYPRYLAAQSSAYGKEQAKWNVISQLREAKLKNEHREALLSYMLFNPNFDRNMISNELVHSQFCTPDEALAMLAQVYDQQGANENMEKFVDWMLTHNKFKDNQAAKNFAADVKAKRPGKNVSIATYTQLLNLPVNKENVNAIMNLCEVYAKSCPGIVPGSLEKANDMQEYLNYKVWECNSRIKDNDKVLQYAKTWAPKLKQTGNTWTTTLRDVFEKESDRRGKTLYQIVPAYVALLQSGQNPNDAWQELRTFCHNNVTPEKTDVSLYAPIYGKFDNFTMEFIRTTRSSWSPEFFNKQLKLAADAYPESTSYDIYNNFLNFVNNDNYGKLVDFDTAKAMLDKFMAIEKYNNFANYDRRYVMINFLFQGGKTDDALKLINYYFGVVAKYNRLERLNAIRSLLYNFWNVPAKVSAPALLEYARAYEALTVQERKLHQVPGRMVEQLNWFANNKEAPKEHKEFFGKFSARVMEDLVAGNVQVQNWDMMFYAEPVAAQIELDCKNKDAYKAARGAALLLKILRSDTDLYRGMNATRRTVKALEEAKFDQIAYSYLTNISKLRTNVGEAVRNDYTAYIAKLSRNIPGIVPVDKSDPAYPLFAAMQELAEGNTKLAWNQTRDKVDLLTKRYKEFDTGFVIWVVDQLRKQKMYKEGTNLAMTVWLDEEKLDPEDAALLGLYKGDLYRDMKNIPAAKIEYEALLSNSRYNKTIAAKPAKFRIVELLIMTQDFSGARLMLERLIDSGSLEEQADAYYMLASVEFEQKEYESAVDYLKQVFKRVHGHVDGRLLEGKLRIVTRNLSSYEIPIGPKRLQTIAIPGKDLDFQIQDNDLSIARGSKAIPVIVTTSDGKDSEKIELMASAEDSTLFSGKISTSLGKAVPNNLLLELNGNDKVEYVIDPEFQKAYKLNYPSKMLEVKSAARLEASAKRIMSEQEKNEMEQGSTLDLVRAARLEKTVRPGSPIYIQVTDPDCNTGATPGKVTVDLNATSGDEIKNFELTESAPYSGVFVGVVPTSVPFPAANASDAQEDCDINAVINFNKSGSWLSLPDGNKPKYLEVDTMSSYNFKTIELKMNPETVKKFTVSAALEQKEELLGEYPANQEEARGGLKIRVVESSEAALDRMQGIFARANAKTYYADTPEFKRENSDQKGRQGWFIYEMSGTFYVPENIEIDLKFLHPLTNQHWLVNYLLVDDKVVLGYGAANAQNLENVSTIFLSKGIHTMKLYGRDYHADTMFAVGYAKADGTFELLPEEWFSVGMSEELFNYLKPKGEITKSPEGFNLTLSEPARYRKVKFNFEDFTGNQLAVKEVAAFDENGARILPVEQDLATGKNNQILEVAAGDKIEIKYEDRRRLDDTRPSLKENLSSSFANGSIDLSYEEVSVSPEGYPSTKYSPAKRVQNGDTLMVVVNDADEDRGLDNQTLTVHVNSSSGEKLDLDLAFDRSKNSFMQIFKLGEVTGGDTIKFSPGDTITVSYLDKENNSHGIPVERSYSVTATEGGQPEIVIFNTDVKPVEDKSQLALRKIAQMRDNGDKREDIKIFKDQIEATILRDAQNDKNVPVVIAGKAPLLFEVNYPEMAKHADSKITIRVAAKSEIDSATQEGREVKYAKFPIGIKGITETARSKGYPIQLKNRPVLSPEDQLERGVFTGVVRLQLGSPTDEINDVVDSNNTFDIMSQNDLRNADAFKVPTIIVTGSDQIVVEVVDEEDKVLATRSAQMRTDGTLEIMDNKFISPVESVHIGQNFYLKVVDPDRDLTASRDEVKVHAKSGLGDEIDLVLTETLPHSGVFTGSVKPELFLPNGESKAPVPNDGILHSTFGDKIEFTYVDPMPLAGTQPMEVKIAGSIVLGADGEIASFTKRFKDSEMAVKTNFLMAEALFEMAKSHRKLNKEEVANEEIARGKRILEEALRDYPDTSLKAQGEFLLANLAQQLKNYQEAVGRYSIVINRYPESEYAAKAQFQKAQCLENMGQNEQACEEYVRLTYLYPDNPLAADAKVRLGNFYYKNKRYKSAATIFRKFSENHPAHALAARSLFLAAHSELRYLKEMGEQAEAEKRTFVADYSDAVKTFEELIKKYDEDKDLRAEAMYWLGDTYFNSAKSGNKKGFEKSYQVFTTLTFEYPESKWAKMARGRLADVGK